VKVRALARIGCAPAALRSGLADSMSDYYDLKRSQIADGAALLGFLVCFLGSGPAAWPYLSVGFQTGEITRGFFFFLATVSAAGVLGGAVGFLIGIASARIWERIHRRRRSKGSPASAAVLPPVGGGASRR
jgi:hypothetical protein